MINDNEELTNSKNELLLNMELTSIDMERIEIIEEYLQLAKQYMMVNVNRIRINSRKCQGCQMPLEYNLVEESNGVKHCQCGVEVKNYCCMKTLNSALDEKDRNSRDISNRGKSTISENRLSFEKAIEYYQGLQRIKFPSELFDLLDKYFAAYGLITRVKAKQLPLICNVNPDHPYYSMSMKTKPGTSVNIMIIALLKTGNPAYYDHVHLLCAIQWGWQLANISSFKEQILNDYDQTQPVYLQWFTNKYGIPNTPYGPKKYSNLNIWYRLMRHLQARNFPCRREHFKTVSDNTLEKYEEPWRLMVANLGLDYFPV